MKVNFKNGLRSQPFIITAFAVLFLFIYTGAAAHDANVKSSSAITELKGLTAPADQETELTVIPADAVGGMGDINLYPRRIVFNPRQRISTVVLYNRVPVIGEYKIIVRDMVMTAEGGLVTLDDPRAKANADRLHTASNMLRWSPRRVRLLGSEAQTVRVMARPPADLPDGEYRSHFTVISEPNVKNEGFSIEDAEGEGSIEAGIGVVIRPRFAISIPVIVRIGETTLQVGMEDMSFINTTVGTAIRLTLTRSGTRSAYGDLIITAAGIGEPIAVVRGLGIYPEVDSQTVEVIFRQDFDEEVLRTGLALTAKFVDDDVNPGETLVSQNFVVP